MSYFYWGPVELFYVWLYFLSIIDLLIVAFNSGIIYLGNSIAKTLNGIKFLALPVSILYAIFVYFDLS